MSNVLALPQQPMGAALVPGNMADAMRLAEMMAKAGFLARELQTTGGALFVIEQSMRWNMSPFAVAMETSFIQGKPMFSGKIVAAAVVSSGAITGRLHYDYDGEGDNRRITVTGTLRGESEPRSISVTVKEAKTNNRVWQTQPDQQLAYHGARVWARRHAPEVMLGVLSPEEMETAPAEPRRVENLARDLEVPREPPPAGSMREAAAEIVGKQAPGYPLLAPDGRLVELRNGSWLRGVEKAVAQMEDAAALATWRAAMGPHLASMAEAGEHEMVEQAERIMDQRRDAFAEAQP